MCLIKRIFLILFLIPSICSAAEHYIIDGGSGDGSSWSSALGALPDTLTRGDTYYIGDGTYAAYTFNDATSGTSVITVKKATETDHGSGADWQSDYGDGVASFSGPLNFDTDYWVFDGSTRSSESSGHGFYVYSDVKGVDVTGVDNITIKYVEIEGHGDDGDQAIENDCIYSSSTSNNITIQYVYLHESGRTHILSRGGTWVLEYSFLINNESTSDEHAESWSLGVGTSNITIRYNHFKSTEGTAVITHLNGGTSTLQIYGNIFEECSGSNGSVSCTNSGTNCTTYFYNNTLYGITGYSSRVDCGTGATCSLDTKNNIWMNSSAANHDGTADYNFYVNTTHTEEANEQTSASSPFTNAAGGDFTLSSATTAGTTLSSSYNQDILGNTRGEDGVWDRGAYEYSASSGSTSMGSKPLLP